MESWHPMWIILLTALSGVFIYGYLWVLYASDTLLKVFTILTLPPIFAFYPSINAMRGYFKEKRIRRLVAVAVFLSLLVSLPFATYAVFRQDWSFRISSERLAYKLGDNVTVTAKITNNAFLTQSVKDMGWRIEFEVRNASWGWVYHEFVSLFELDIPISPGDSLERSFTWTSPSTVGNYSISAEVYGYFYTPHFYGNLTVTISP